MNRNVQNGFSLVELIITIILVGIAFPALLAFFVNIMDDSVDNELIHESILLAHEKMEDVLADKNNPNRGLAYIQTSGSYPSESVGQFTRTVAVTDTTINSVDGTQVLVRISHSLIDDYTVTVFLTAY